MFTAIKSLLQTTRGSRRNRRPNGSRRLRFRAQFESLENRRMFAGIDFNDGLVEITGGQFNDLALVAQISDEQGDPVAIEISLYDLGDFNPAGFDYQNAPEPDYREVYDAQSVEKIVFYGLAGNDGFAEHADPDKAIFKR